MMTHYFLVDLGRVNLVDLRHAPCVLAGKIDRKALQSQCGITLRQSDTFKGQEAFVRAARYAHARQFNRAAAQTKKLRPLSILAGVDAMGLLLRALNPPWKVRPSALN